MPSAKEKKKLSLINKILVTNDDDVERSLLRNEAKLNTSLNSTLNINSPSKRYKTHEIVSHLDTCLKLFTENKINQKNAWQIKVIDLITSFVHNKTFASDTLKMATSSLEIGGKIYGLRVDDIYALGLQIASNMARAAASQNSNENEDNDVEGICVAKSTRKKAQREFKLLPGVSPTLELENKLIGVPETIPTESWSTDCSNQGIEKLLTNKIDRNNNCTKYLFLEKSSALTDKVDELIEPKDPFNFNINLNQEQLCTTFEAFNFLDWNPEDSSLQNASEDNLNGDEIFYDDKGFPIHELDGSLVIPEQDDFQDRLSDDSAGEEVEIGCEAGRQAVQFIQTLKPDATACGNEYLYKAAPSDFFIHYLWAGPDHWRLKHIQRPSKTNENKTHAVDCKRAKKDKAPLVEMGRVELVNENKVIRRRNAKKSQILPINYVTDFPSATKLLLSNRSIQPICDNKLNSNHKEVESDHEYDYNNLNDSQFCIDQEQIPSIDDDMDDENNENVDAFENYDEIEAPETVPKSTIAYATKAKRMNMKKLKCALWDGLSGENTFMQADNIQQGSSKPLEGKLNFRKQYEEVLPKTLTTMMKESLSAPLAFVALLHLCNENNLRLESVPDYTDLIISQDII